MRAGFTAPRGAYETDLAARGVRAAGDMPAYVRIEAGEFPLGFTVLVDPEDAVLFAMELLAASEAARA